MKTLLLLPLLLLSLAGQAQTDSLLYSLQHRYNTIGQGYLPTDYLYDRTLPMSSIGVFDGTYDTTITPANWEQVYRYRLRAGALPAHPLWGHP